MKVNGIRDRLNNYIKAPETNELNPDHESNSKVLFLLLVVAESLLRFT